MALRCILFAIVALCIPALPCAQVVAGTDIVSPLYYVLHGLTVLGNPIKESTATDAPTLAALCASTPSCGGFTVGSGGGEPGMSLRALRSSTVYGMSKDTKLTVLPLRLHYACTHTLYHTSTTTNDEATHSDHASHAHCHNRWIVRHSHTMHVV